MKHLRVVRGMPKNRHLQNIVGTEHITDAAEQAIAAQAEGGATLAFKNVAVAGQSNIVADAATDTLNIAAGANVTITTNASTDTITIAATDTNTDTNTFRPVTAGGNTLGASETLAFTAGSNVTISESAGAVTIAATGGSPGGSDGQIQYNNGGSFGGSSLTFTDTDGSEQFLFSDTSDTALVKIEQLGTGNSFEVHDVANDTSIFKVTSAGSVGIGLPAGTGFGGSKLYVTGNTHTTGSFRAEGTMPASSPPFTFNADTNTGIFTPGADSVGISTGGSERLRVGSAGQIGIAGANYGNAGEVLTSGGASGAVSWAAAGGGGGGLPIHYLDEDNPPTFSNSAGYGSSSLGFSATPGIPQSSGIAGGNFTGSSLQLWAFTWPADNHYIDSIRFRVYSASNAGVESSCQMAFYKADANGWPGARTGSNVTITPTSTSGHFLTTTLGSGSGIGPFNRGDLIWAGFCGPAATQRGQTVGTIRFYGQSTNLYPVAGMNQSTAGPNPGYYYLYPLRLYINSGGLTAFPSDLRDGSTWTSVYGGSPSSYEIIPSTFTLSSTNYFPAIQIHMRDTA